jgi:exodeoxyribonuclease-5
MTQIVRTGAGSEITKLAGMLRNRDLNWTKVIWQNEVRKTGQLNSNFITALKNSDVCIAHQNKTCNLYNYEIRDLKGLQGKNEFQPVRGDLLMAWQTLDHLGIIKGATYTVMAAMPCNGGFLVRFAETYAGQPITVNVAYPNLRDQATKDKVKGCFPFSFAHCITAHKSQGSEWDNVVVINDYARQNEPEYWNWLYTSVTRAKKSITIVL